MQHEPEDQTRVKTYLAENPYFGGTLVDVGNCPLCGQPTFIEVTPEQADRILLWYSADNPPAVQEAFPDLTLSQRESLISMSHGRCFDKAFPDE